MTVFESEHLRATCQSGVQAFFALVYPTLQGIQAVADLNMRAAKAAMSESEAALTGALQSHNPVEFFAQQVTASQQAAARAVSYGQSLADIATNTHAEWSKAARAQAELHEQQFKALSGGLSPNVPAGPQAWIAAMNSMFSAAGTTAEAMRNASRQAIETAQGGFDTITLLARNAGQHGAAQTARAAK